MLLGLPRRALRVLLAVTAALAPGLLVLPSAAAQPIARTAAHTAACPAEGEVTQPYHPGHNGVDIGNDIGTPIYAIGDGEVTISGYTGDYGQWIRVLHPDGRISEYGHMYQRFVAVGEHVTAGQRIALMGQEGNSTGPHLHLRIWGDTSTSYGIDPEVYLAEHGVTLPCVPGGTPQPRPLTYPAESGRVVSARSADGRLEVFAAGADGVHHAWQLAQNAEWSAWEFLGGPGNAELAIAPNADGRLEMFAINGSTFQHRY
ncbi:peptidoglycan DD-metalloendopeptidase family protein, partial [Streptomyces sp. NPDC091278]